MLDDDHFVGCHVIDRTGTPVGTLVEILHGDEPRAVVRQRAARREVAIERAQWDSAQRTLRLPYDAESLEHPS